MTTHIVDISINDTNILQFNKVDLSFETRDTLNNIVIYFYDCIATLLPVDFLK